MKSHRCSLVSRLPMTVLRTAGTFSLDNQAIRPDDPSRLRLPAIIALSAILPIGLWGSGPCSHCDQPVTPTCHEHQAAAEGHELPLPKDSPDCACPTHQLCAVSPGSSASISPSADANRVRAPLVLLATAATVFVAASPTATRAAGRASPPGRPPHLYLTHRALLI